jgi:hypothetical protein
MSTTSPTLACAGCTKLLPPSLANPDADPAAVSSYLKMKARPPKGVLPFFLAPLESDRFCSVLEEVRSALTEEAT